MMTPQEVASHSFAKATLGGYNLAQVDEFLDALTEDYTALYNENAILKNKLKVLSDTVEEYRATEGTMRKALLAAQQLADSMVEEAKKKQEELMGEAQEDAHKRIAELDKAVADEEYRLRKAQESTAAYVRKLTQVHNQELEFLANLSELVPPEVMAQEQEDETAAEIGAALAVLSAQEPPVQPQEQPGLEPGDEDTAVYTVIPQGDGQDFMNDEELDPDATRRFSDMQFGKDYKIE